MSVDPALLSILRCPDEHHAELTLDADAQTLTCTECGRIFEIRDGIPVLLLDEARQPSADGAVENGTGGESAKTEEGGAA
ncbi:Trm112 family protein [Dactylosporangium sp. NPDC000244]|uniref:Trm112 family protein n=1 Tax=Dactylosporangium sp. NPDC000244 TaxID=3154365 RepID=UPI0033283D18|nr:Trm112 family protein [Dactylosporangium thailandense]